MNLKIIVLESDAEMIIKNQVINDFSEKLNYHFLNKSYGEDIEILRFVIILIKTKPGYEAWFKPRRPKYTRFEIYENLLGERNERVKELVLETKFDYEVYDAFLEASYEESFQIIAEQMLIYFSNLKKLPKAINAFDLNKFKSDLYDFFLQMGYVNKDFKFESK